MSIIYIYLSIYLSINLSIHPPFHTSIHLSHPSICLFICLCLSIYLSIYLSIFLFIYIFVFSCVHSSKSKCFLFTSSLIYLSYLPMCINADMLYTNFYGLYLNPYVSYTYIIKSMQTYAKCRSRIEKLISLQLGK